MGAIGPENSVGRVGGRLDGESLGDRLALGGLQLGISDDVGRDLHSDVVAKPHCLGAVAFSDLCLALGGLLSGDPLALKFVGRGLEDL